MLGAFADSNRLIRYKLYKKFGIPFRPKAPDFPRMVLLEPTNYCNLLCAHCAYKTIVKNSNYKQGFMKFVLYKKIIDEISKYKGITLRPFDRGEALMSHDLPKMIRYAKEKGIERVWLNTNGVLLSSQMSKELLGAGLDQLEISIDAVSRETFEKIKGKDEYDQVVKNTIEYCRLKKKLYPKTKSVVSFVESEMNTFEKDDFIKFWQNYADYVNIRPVHQHGSLVENQRVSKEKKGERRLPCSILWERISIDFCGNARFCEIDWENIGIMGNINDFSIKEIWNSEKYKQLRKLHLERKFSEIALCNICKSYYEAGRWG